MYCNNSPVKFSDPNGEFAVLALVGALAVSAIVCAAVDLGSQLISNKGDLSSVNWRSVGASAASGVVTAGMAAVTAGA